MSALSKRANLADNFLYLGFLCVFAPFFLLLIFNHPSVDDFDYATTCTRLGFWKAQSFWYFSWQGRYTSAAVLSLSPVAVHSFFLYKLVPLFLLLGLFHALYALARELITPYFDRRKTLAAVLMLLAFYLAKMPSIVQGFYWYAGAMTYQFADILMLYLCVCILKMKKAPDVKMAGVWAGLAFILTAVIAGTNETTMVLLLVLLSSFLAWSLCTSRRVDWMMLGLLITAGIGAFIVMTAPGNAVRMAEDSPQKQSLLHVVRMCLENDIASIFHWAVVLPMAGMTVLCVDLSIRMAGQRIKTGKGPFIHPAFSTIAYFLLVTAGFLPGFWSLGGLPPERTINALFLLFLLGWFINLYIVVEFCMRKYHWTAPALPYYVKAILCVFVFLSFYKDDTGIRTAYSDVLTGKAAKYNRELRARYDAISKCGDMCQVEELKHKPASIYFDDITIDPNDWRNRSYAQYFHKKSMVLLKPSPNL